MLEAGEERVKMETSQTFGQYIAWARERAGLTLREMAALIIKEDGTPMSNQYLSDIENDRRNPPADHAPCAN